MVDDDFLLIHFKFPIISDSTFTSVSEMGLGQTLFKGFVIRNPNLLLMYPTELSCCLRKAYIKMMPEALLWQIAAHLSEKFDTFVVADTSVIVEVGLFEVSLQPLIEIVTPFLIATICSF